MSNNLRSLFKDPSEMPDGALVSAAREGHTWAQEALYKRYVRSAVGQAWRLIPNDDSEDLAQNALVHALTNLHKLEQPQAFASWLSSIVVRLALTHLRRKHLFARLGLRHAAPPNVDSMLSVASLEARVQLREIYSVLETLAPEERTALVLRRIEGLELKQVAEAMKLSLATVKRRLSTAEARLSSMKKEHDDAN
jgi:RNA polymerase sigma-70 factor, ECF subfamily